MLMPPLRLHIAPPQTRLQAALWACASSLGLVFAYSCGYNLLLFAPSIYLLQIYDRVLSSRSGNTLLMLSLIVALTVVVGGVLDALRRAVLGRLGAWLEDRLRPSVLSACLDYANRGIRVNVVAPGPILTHHLDRAGPEAQRLAGLSVPMGRIGTTREVSDVVLWLCSQHASFVTGATVPVDGGQLAGEKPSQMYRQGEGMART